MRNLASIRVIKDIKPITGADAIECALVDGWSVVVKKNEFEVGDQCIYIEIDSWVPHTLAPFLSKGQAPREYDGVKGERLRTVKLRGQVSQGLVLPLSVISLEEYENAKGDVKDLTELLGIKKYGPPIPAELAGQMKGYFPSFIRKTDQERIQNLTDNIVGWSNEELFWEVTEKLEGASMTVYVNGLDSGVCSRNIDLLESETNTFWKMEKKYNIINSIKKCGRNLAIQGELVGPNIEGNIYNLKEHSFFVYDIFDIDKQEYLLHKERVEVLVSHFSDLPIMPHVPVVASIYKLSKDVNELLNFANGVSKLANTAREGVVFKCVSKNISFKVISNEYLVKQK